MHRRQFLAAAACLPAAGCSALTGPQKLRTTDPVHEDGRSSVRFLSDDGEVMNFFVDHYHPYGERDPEIPLQLNVRHAENTHLDSVRFTIDAPSEGSGPPVALYFRRPATPWPEFTYEEGRPGFRTIVAVDDLDHVGGGSFALDFLGIPLDTPPTIDLAVRGEFRLSEADVLGTTYRADATISFTVPRETS